MTTDSVGGVWSYCVELIRALEPRGVTVTLANLGPAPSAEQRRGLAGLANVEFVAHPGRLEWMDDCEDDLAAAGDWLLAVEQRCRPDVVHLSGYAQASLAWAAPALIVAHSCLASWTAAVLGEQLPPRWAGYRERVRAGLRAARAVVGPSAWMLGQLLEHYQVRFDGLVIHNARRGTDYLPGPKAELILAAGRLWDRGKNLAALAAVGPRVAWPIRVAGSTCDPNGRRVAAEQVEHVELLGPLAPAQLAWWMSQATIFAHPARYEPFGLAPVEAALSGCALVLGNIASLRELWGDAAVYVDPDDHDALAATLHALIRDPVRRNSMATRARARAQRYGVGRMARAYHNLYLELIHERAVPACAS